MTDARDQETDEHLLLKWGTLKGWKLGGNEKAIGLLRRYGELGVSASAMAQHDSDEQQQILCDLIDAVNGRIEHDWTGEEMTKAEAKKYILEYRHPARATGAKP